MSKITLAHGGGGRLQDELIRNEIAPRFNNTMLASLPDGALTPENLVISSDSFVITPRQFPGGNIGKLAVIGTVNDVLMAGGVPKYLTCSLIIEEGLELDELRLYLDSMAETAKQCGVTIVTGDTKVVPAGAGDGLYINTAGVGFKNPALNLGSSRIAAGDKILVSRSIGEHGLSVLASRFGLDSAELKSDCACLSAAVQALIDQTQQGAGLKFMRDATRGGMLGIINEIFENSALSAKLYSENFPVSKAAGAIAKLLGIDPGFAACEGCLTAIVACDFADACIQALQKLPGGAEAAIVGEVISGDGTVMLCSNWGAMRKLVVSDGDQLPRIC